VRVQVGELAQEVASVVVDQPAVAVAVAVAGIAVVAPLVVAQIGVAVAVVVHIPLQPLQLIQLQLLVPVDLLQSLTSMLQHQQLFQLLNQLQHNLLVHSHIQ
jgi:hypothetical protein